MDQRDTTREGAYVVHVHERVSCLLCGSPGKPLYCLLQDRLFSAPGNWGFRKCVNPACRLLWLDPIPVKEDIPIVYRDYYTHGDAGEAGKVRSPEPNTDRRAGLIRNLRSLYRALLSVAPGRRERQRLDEMYLDGVKPGRLLELGCGDGRRLAGFRAAGWDTMGQEVDPAAAEHARNTYGLLVEVGDLRDLEFPPHSVDCIIMNQVLEHIDDPVSLLAECRRVLRPGGTLVAVTPNCEGFGHKLFGPHWRGLEPPRHLCIFHPEALRAAARNAGFEMFQVSTSTANSYYTVMGSLLLLTDSVSRPPFMFLAAAFSIFFQLLFDLLHLEARDSGEDCVLVCTA